MTRGYSRMETLLQAKQRTGAKTLQTFGVLPEFTKAGRLTAKSTRHLRARGYVWSPDDINWVKR